MKYQKRLFMVSTFNGIVDLLLPSAITFTSVTFFIFFANRPLTPSYIVLAMVIKKNLLIIFKFKLKLIELLHEDKQFTWIFFYQSNNNINSSQSEHQENASKLNLNFFF